MQLIKPISGTRGIKQGPLAEENIRVQQKIREKKILSQFGYSKSYF